MMFSRVPFGLAMSDRRQRIHDLVLALLAQQGDLELLDSDASAPPPGDPGIYQALVRSAVTLDALIDQELGGGATRKIGQGFQDDSA
jgi:hypothetical protein